MIPWRLVLRNLGAHPLRSLLTVGSMTVAVFLLCVLHSILAALEAPLRAAASNRLYVQSDTSLFVNLPLAYQSKLEAVAGVETICKWQWFGGYYRERKNFFAQFAVDRRRLFETYPEIEIVAGDAQRFFSTRTAAIVGVDLADRFGWKVGDRIPLKGTIFARVDGAPWQFDLAAIYRSNSASVDNQTFFFAFDYLRESLEGGGAYGPPGVGVYSLRLASGCDPTQVMAEVDALFENGPQRVQATTEAEFTRQFITMMGNIPTLLSSIGSGVLFAILVAVLNTMIMAGRERTRDIGVLKALGFPDRSVFVLLMCESLLLCLLGGLPGIALALLAQKALAVALATFLPGYALGAGTIALGLAMAAGLGLLAGLAPAWQAVRLQPVLALRREV